MDTDPRGPSAGNPGSLLRRVRISKVQINRDAEMVATHLSCSLNGGACLPHPMSLSKGGWYDKGE